MYRSILIGVALVALGTTVDARQGVTMQFREGRVTLHAQNAPVRAILAEWARLGGTTIVNGDRVVGAPVTLELVDVTERQALDIVLRNVAGYMLAPRRAAAASTASAASAFDRILILPTSAAPPTPPPGPAGRPGQQRPGLVQRPETPPEGFNGDQVDAVESPAPTPNVPPRVFPPVVRGQLPNTADAPPDGEPQEQAPEETPEYEPAVGANPFAPPPGAAQRPGVIVPVPRPQPQQGQ